MNKKTLIIVFVVLLVLFVAVRILFPGGGNEVTVEVTPEDRQMMQNMMPGMAGPQAPMVMPPTQPQQ